MLEVLYRGTIESNPDRAFISESIHAIRNLQIRSRLWAFQNSKGEGPAGKLQWCDLVSEEERAKYSKAEAKRQW
jgi:hypothetical protein